MAQGQELFDLMDKAKNKGITMSEMGRRGGLSRKKRKKVTWYERAAKSHTEEEMARVPYMD